VDLTAYEDFTYLDITVDDGVALVEITHPEYNMRGHYELNAIWHLIERDPQVRATLLTWAVPPSKEPPAPHYPAELGPEAREADPGQWWADWQWPIREAREGTRNVLDSNKIVVSALRGSVPYGSGLILATVADVSIAADDAIIADRHIDAGMVVGDGAVHWMLSCGVQKAKLLALSAEEITGADAADIGLVSMSVPDERVMEKAWEYARKFAEGPQHALGYTKRAFNSWLRLGNLVSFEVSNAWAIANIQADPDVVVAAGWEKAGQGQPRGYDVNTRPAMPSASSRIGPNRFAPRP